LLAQPVLSIFTGAFFLFLFSCGDTSENENTVKNENAFKKHALNPIYAKGFTVYENDSVIRLTSRNPDDTTQVYKVLDLNKTDLPFKKIAITSTTHAFLFDAIGANNFIVGMSAMSYLLDSSLKATYAKNGVTELGKDDNLNREIIVKLDPQILMVYPCPGCDYSDYEKAGITVINNAEYLEQDPLGRAEWLKVAGLLVNKPIGALHCFNAITEEYKKAAGMPYKLAKGPEHVIPQVILGKPIDNVWHVPGKNSFAAKLIDDAGLKYAFYEVEGNNVKPQNIEWIITRAKDAKYWVFTDFSTDNINLTSLAKQNKVFKTLAPFQDKNVIVCNSAKDDFFGKAVIEPHILLKDLVYHFYGQDGLSDIGYSAAEKYQPTYFKKIQEK
jgi:iron complex transport system substrate-binding protein